MWVGSFSRWFLEKKTVVVSLFVKVLWKQHMLQKPLTFQMFAITVVVGLHLIYTTMLKSNSWKKVHKGSKVCTSCVADGKEPVTSGKCSNLAKTEKWSQTLFFGVLNFIIYTHFIYVYLYCLLTYLNS